MLTNKQIKQFETDGYLVVPDVLEASVLNSVRA